MHKVIYWKGNPKIRKVFYFEHYKKFGTTNVFKIGTTDAETLYLQENQIYRIIWDNSIIKRKK